MDVRDWLEKRRIFEYIAGSHSYGLNHAESDEDFRGVAIAPLDYYYGFFTFDQLESKDPDRTIFDIKKFFKLASDCNPNIIEFLFAPEDCIKLITPEWRSIVDHRTEFLSKKAKYTYAGYAYSQLKRIKTHRAWLLNPPAKKPEREDYGLLDNRKKMSAEDMGYIETAAAAKLGVDRNEIINGNVDISTAGIKISDEVMVLYINERQYRNAKNHWDQYENWKNTRNPKRAELEAKFGYDTKHAMHIFRLLLQAEDILSKGDLSVRLTPENREFCISIREGKWTYDQIIEMSDAKSILLDEMYEKSTIPNSVNLKKLNELLVNTINCYQIKESTNGRIDELPIKQDEQCNP